ncbi:MAG: Hpt domain-containing protein [Endozoicomonas sp.]
MAEQQDYAGLGWVKGEITATLTEARQGLEKHLGESGNPAHLVSSQKAFDQIYSTLKMLQQVGATHLALEMKQLAEAVGNGRVQQADSALDCLMQACLQLPGYIEHIIGSGMDRPMSILPLINEMRALRDADLLPESTFFFPDLDHEISPVSSDHLQRLKSSGLDPLLRKLRQKYQIALAGYLREQNRPKQLQLMGRIFAKLQDLLWGSPISPLWEASVALTEGLAEHSIEQTLNVANLLRELDHQLRTFIDQGVSFINLPPEDELFRGLLYCIATAEGHSGFTGALKDRYNLEETLADATRSVSGTYVGIDVAAPVVQALNDELAGVKDALDLYLLSPEADALILENQLPIVQQVADTLAMLGMDDQRQAMLRQKEVLKDIISKGRSSEQELMGVAAAFLDLEQALSQYAQGQISSSSAETSLMDDVYQAVIQEARKSLDQAKDDIADYLDSHKDPAYLERIPSLLRDIHAGLSMTPLSRAASLVERCRQHIQTVWPDTKNQPQQSGLVHLADAITSIEYYLERLSDKGQGEVEAILEVAEESLLALENDQEEEPEQAPVESALPVFKLDDLAIVKDDSPFSVEQRQSQHQPVEGSTQETPPTVTIAQKSAVFSIDDPMENTTNDGSDSDLIEFEFSTSSISTPAPSTPAETEPVLSPALVLAPESLEINLEEETPHLHSQDESGIFPETSPEPELSVSTSGQPEVNDDLLEDELLQVFIDEAGEVQQQLSVKIPHWQANSEDTEALKDIRRAFHTLKGSGRMVEANVVGELAWSVENMLNRLIDGSIHAGPVLHDLIGRVIALLPELIDDFSRQNQLLTPEVLLCMEQADALARGERVPITEEQADEASADFFESVELEETVLEPEGEEKALEPEPVLPEPELFQPESGFYVLGSEHQQTGPESDVLYDQQLLAVFLPEARIHLQTVFDFIDEVRSRGGKLQINDQIQRALHTLKGMTRMAEIEPLAILVTAIERNVKDFRAHLVPADDRVVRMLTEGLQLIESGLEQIEATGREPDLDAESYLSWLEALHAQLIAEQQKLQASTRLHSIGQKAALFLTEGIELLLDAESYLEKWRQGMSAGELDLFRTELATLSERSREARLDTLAELCEVLLDVCEYLGQHHSRLPAPLVSPLSNGFEALVDMMNQVAAQQTPVSPQPIFTALRKSLEALLVQDLENSSVELEETVHDLSAEDDDELLKLEAVYTFEIPEPAEVEARPEQDNHEEMLTGMEFPEDLAFETLSDEVVSEETITPQEITQPEPYTPTPLNVEVEEHDQELMELFLEEAADLTEDCAQSLELWLDDRQNLEYVAELQRSLHTLKGGARMADQPELGDISHAIEDIYESIVEGRLPAGSAPLALLQTAHDQIDNMLLAIRQQEALPDPADIITRLQQWPEETALKSTSAASGAQTAIPDYLGSVTSFENSADTGTPESTRPLDTVASSEAELEVLQSAVTAQSSFNPEIRIEEATPTTTRLTTPVTQSLPKTSEMMRVPSELLEQLVDLSGESNITRTRIEQQTLEVRQTLDEMESTINRVKEQLRRLDIETQTQILSSHEAESGGNPDFDPLEMDQYSELTQLSRSLVESATDLMDLKEVILNKNRDAETLLLQQSRTQIDLQEKLMRARMVSFGRLLPRLRKITRQLSSELDKPVELNVTNAEGEMDRTMLERILGPLEHLLRNAIDHGIENSREERLQQGKPEAGQLELSIKRDGADIMLVLSDDGLGIDTEAVYATAVEKHMIAPGDQLLPKEVAQLILEPGFSTAESVTQISGRGLGLDVVNTAVRQLGGSVEIDSQTSKGTRFILRLPFTLSVNRALMVEAGGVLYAIPMPAIDGVTVVHTNTVMDCYQNQKTLEYGGQEHRVMFLGELLGGVTPRIQEDQASLLIVQRGGQNIALHVDAITGNREIITKSLGPQFAGLTGVNGATMLGDGRVVIIIDPAALIRKHRATEHLVDTPVPEIAANEVSARVLVVDDSVTVRKVTSRILTREGYTVDSARDGVEAMASLSERVPDIVLLDIEMPRMDGYEVASAIRNDPKLQSLPIVMITSRTGEKHRARAFSLGVNEYIGKPYQETVLLEIIENLIGPQSLKGAGTG